MQTTAKVNFSIKPKFTPHKCTMIFMPFSPESWTLFMGPCLNKSVTVIWPCLTAQKPVPQTRRHKGPLRSWHTRGCYHLVEELGYHCPHHILFSSSSNITSWAFSCQSRSSVKIKTARIHVNISRRPHKRITQKNHCF